MEDVPEGPAKICKSNKLNLIWDTFLQVISLLPTFGSVNTALFPQGPIIEQ